MTNLRHAWIVVSTVAALAGCAGDSLKVTVSVPNPRLNRAGMVVVVADFEESGPPYEFGTTEISWLDGAGVTVADHVATALADTGYYQIKGRGELRQLVLRKRRTADDVNYELSPTELGRELGADAVVVGRVQTYGTWEDEDLKVWGSVAHFTWEMVDSATGNVVVRCDANSGKTSTQPGMTLIWACERLTQKLREHLRMQPPAPGSAAVPSKTRAAPPVPVRR